MKIRFLLLALPQLLEVCDLTLSPRQLNGYRKLLALFDETEGSEGSEGSKEHGSSPRCATFDPLMQGALSSWMYHRTPQDPRMHKLFRERFTKVRREAELKEAELKEAERREAELKEAVRREAERREAELKEAELKEAELKEAEPGNKS